MNNGMEQFKGKQVKIVYGITRFALWGVIEDVKGDFIVFRTQQRVSMINIREIHEIVEI